MASDHIRTAAGLFYAGRSTTIGRISHLLGFGVWSQLLSALDQYFICAQHSGIGFRWAAFAWCINQKSRGRIDSDTGSTFLQVLDPGFECPFGIDWFLSPIDIQNNANYL